jgi:hypothetical protein
MGIMAPNKNKTNRFSWRLLLYGCFNGLSQDRGLPDKK